MKIFTDGSVCNSAVGFGACAAVLYSVYDNEEIQIETCAIGNKVSSFETEVAGLVLGMKMYVDFCHQNTYMETVYISCDCLMAIDAVDRCSPSIRSDNLYPGLAPSGGYFF